MSSFSAAESLRKVIIMCQFGCNRKHMLGNEHVKVLGTVLTGSAQWFSPLPPLPRVATGPLAGSV